MKQKIGVGFGVLMLKNGKILLGKRHDDPEKASSELHGEGTWTMPGGKLHFGETFEQGAIREVLEETGMTLNSTNIIAINEDILPDVHFITGGLFSDDFSGEPKVMEPDEITVWEWFSPDALPKNMYPPSVKLLENYKQKKFYIQKFTP